MRLRSYMLSARTLLHPLALMAVFALVGCDSCDPPPPNADADVGPREAGADLDGEPAPDQDGQPAPDLDGGEDLSDAFDASDGPLDDADSAPSDGLDITPLGDGPSAGTLTVLSYNVAGLPFGLSQSDPLKNTPLISPLLNAYALVLMQEDFAFTTQLSSKALHPYKTKPGTAAPGTFMNDGLTRFADDAYAGHTRIKWTACNGIFDQSNDCLASKGFSVAVTTLGPGVEVDVYNLHMDAGNSSGDLTARAKQVDQLLADITTRAAGRAIIVAGDTNIRPSKNTQNATMLAKLLTNAGLTDACVHLSCGDADRIDRVMYRSSATVQLEAKSWKIDTTFIDSAGKDLSDHEAVGVVLSWKVLTPGGG
jgi:hypothetical protein